MTSTTRSFVAVLALCVCLGGVVQGTTFSRPAPENPAHPGKCYDAKLKQAVAAGASITDHSSCTRLRCSKSNANPPSFSLSGETCSYASRLPTNCELAKGDPSADFPDCCSKVKCDGAPQGSVRIVG